LDNNEKYLYQLIMENIIGRIAQLYIKYGIRSVTMDDLARELGLSKKTLYLHFNDKNDVVHKAMKHLMNIQECGIDQVLGITGQNAIDELLGISKQITLHLQNLNPALAYDLQKYYPDIWKEFIDYKKQIIYNHIIGNFEKGIQEGLYSVDINYDIIALIYVSRMEIYGWSDLGDLSKYSYEHIFNTLFIYHVRGISNKKGLEYLEKLMGTLDHHNTN
jgi:TetR/AcrR family transcriptional regulator, cholesterol catabolism regulator